LEGSGSVLNVFPGLRKTTNTLSQEEREEKGRLKYVDEKRL
jgi:hypothetical protein